MDYYSFAGPSKGKTDPTDVDKVTVSDEQCDVDGCTKDHCEHVVFMWSGGEYSKNASWIAAESEYTITLEDAR